MSEKREEIAVENRNYGKYYVVFSGLLILATLWAVVDEVKVRRPWKDYQAEYYALAVAKIDSLKASALMEIDSAQAASLRQALDSAQDGMQSAEYTRAAREKESLLKELDVATTGWRESRGRSDAAYYQYQKAKLEEGRDDPALRKAVDDDDASAAKYFAVMNGINGRIAALDETIGKYKDALTKAQKEYQDLFAGVNVLKAKAEKMKSAPLQINQVVLEDFEFTPFQEIKARVDRCQTCHMGWKDSTMADAPEPFTKHPVPELLKIHNPETFGCTPCHRGQGPALTAGFAHGDKDENWPAPILHGDDIYATCNSCHSSETILPYARPFTRAKQLVAESGCFGCHEINGLSDLPKIGPSLNALPAKVKADWIFRWVKNPKEYNPHTRMPNFRFSDDQAAAVTAYLEKIGGESDFKPERPRGMFAGGNAAEGKKIFETVGCQDCHVIGDFMKVREARGTSYDIAPELTRVGSKVNPDWLFDWVRNPRHYNPETRMPNLRLSDGEAKNVVAYLSSLKDPRTEPSPNLDLKNPVKIAEGEKLIREFGCFGCHDIKGMEKEGKVSVDLSDFDRKLIEQMDFGDTRALPHDSPVDFKADSLGATWVKHTWRAWVYGKLHNSRQYQTERIAQRMPVFAFNDEEIGLIRTFLTSMTKDVPAQKYQKPYDRRVQDLEAGRKVIRQYNCMQCHNIEDQGGYILAKYDDPSLGPPILPASQGAKVQEQWLYKFLKGPTPVRPWLKIRMPTFGLTDVEINKIERYFLAKANKEFVLRDYSAIPADEKLLGPGRKLFQTYQCGKCHPSGPVTLGAETSASDLAPNLVQAHERLKPEWILDWLHDPQKLQPGTRMPSFFYEGKGPDETTFGGNADQQIKALETYVWNLGKKGRVLSSIQ